LADATTTAAATWKTTRTKEVYEVGSNRIKSPQKNMTTTALEGYNDIRGADGSFSMAMMHL
jgi:hypothetical protein